MKRKHHHTHTLIRNHKTSGKCAPDITKQILICALTDVDIHSICKNPPARLSVTATEYVPTPTVLVFKCHREIEMRIYWWENEVVMTTGPLWDHSLIDGQHFQSYTLTTHTQLKTRVRCWIVSQSKMNVAKHETCSVALLRLEKINSQNVFEQRQKCSRVSYMSYTVC